ncbi:MAG: HAD family hydrolase [Candidatus Cryptobacteroides sp.]
MTKIAIFDLDGTLLDTVQDLGRATNHALGVCGFPERPIEDYYTLCGRGIYNLFRGALPEGKADEAMVKRMAELFLPYYDEHKCDFTRPYPGITEMLRKITSAGIRPAVASNKYQDGAEKLIRHFFGEFDFVKILGQREGQPIKPDPEIVYQIMSEMPGTAKNEVVYVGDSDVDMQTGANAGVRTIGVSWGFRSRAELEAGKPWGIADNAEELAGMIVY